MPGMDELRPLYRVAFDDVRLPAEALLGGEPDAWPAIRRTLDRGLVMIAAEMVGGAQQCLDDAVAWAKQRVQFGRPIGVNQAIKHKCADMLFQVESARALTYYAALAAEQASEEAALTAAMAKAWAGDAYRHAAAQNLQIHGGSGFTWEFDCHLFLKRAKSDESWLGDGRQHRERVARLLRL
jgi:alkylation response protein AidB-like acyl-CoA dehydrogenase